MINIIAPSEFETVLWKNGRGETTQLAISSNGTVTEFDWRVSIASMVDSGIFSDFSGFWRTLLVVDGRGIELSHGTHQIDLLDSPLQHASFDGRWTTYGRLLAGPVKNFNVMTKQGRYEAHVESVIDVKTIEIQPCDHCLIYSVKTDVALLNTQQLLPAGHLVDVTQPQLSGFVVKGGWMIIIRLISVEA